jgi:hypothetical protein
VQEQTLSQISHPKQEFREALAEIKDLQRRLAEAHRQRDYLEQENVGLRWTIKALRRGASPETTT